MEETEYYLKIMRRIYLRECQQFISLIICLTSIILITWICYILYTKKIQRNKVKKKLTSKNIKKIEANLKDRKLKTKIGCVFLSIFCCIMIVLSCFAFNKNVNKILYDINNMSFQIYEGGFTIELVKRGRKDLLNRDEGRIIFDTTNFYYNNSYYDCLLLDVNGKDKIYDYHSAFSFYKKYYGIIVYGSRSKKVVYWDVDVY